MTVKLSAAKAEIVVVATRVVVFILAAAALVVTAEFPCAPLQVRQAGLSLSHAEEECGGQLQQYHHALYFTIVTLSTVG